MSNVWCRITSLLDGHIQTLSSATADDIQKESEVVLLVFLPQESRIALSADHTFNRGIVHSLFGGQAGRQKAAHTENYSGKPLTRDTRILHRKHYVHHSCIVFSKSSAGKNKTFNCYFHSFLVINLKK